ncbi:hypothetical protein CJI97_004554 [Candidozyma auris]|nr:hypothetical protein CJI97_004554 [[Candida] auris]
MFGNLLFVKITNPQIYTTGSKVQGLVQLIVSNKLDVEAVEVELLGFAESKNYMYINGVYIPKQESHNLLQITKRVFPPPDVQGSYTLTSGVYHYSFEFVFPGRDHVAQCVKHKRIFHSKNHLPNKGRSHATLAGSFFHEIKRDDYCSVQYSVEASATVTSVVKLVMKHSAPVYFAPKNSEIFFSLSDLCNSSKKTLLPDENHACEYLNYSIDGIVKESKSILRKLIPSNTVKVPFELNVRFKEVTPIETVKGTTNRVLQAGSKLSRFVDLDLSTPFSHKDILFALPWKEVHKKGTITPLHIRFTFIKVALVSTVTYRGSTASVATSSVSLRRQPLDLEVNLDAFEEVECHSSKKVPSKHTDKRVCFRHSLDPSLWDCNVKDIGQTFMLCNIQKVAHLCVCLTIAFSDNPTNEIEIENNSPIVFHRQEGPDSSLCSQLKHLPHYMPAPDGLG